MAKPQSVLRLSRKRRKELKITALKSQFGLGWTTREARGIVWRERAIGAHSRIELEKHTRLAQAQAKHLAEAFHSEVRALRIRIPHELSSPKAVARVKTKFHAIQSANALPQRFERVSRLISHLGKISPLEDEQVLIGRTPLNQQEEVCKYLWPGVNDPKSQAEALITHAEIQTRWKYSRYGCNCLIFFSPKAFIESPLTGYMPSWGKLVSQGQF